MQRLRDGELDAMMTPMPFAAIVAGMKCLFRPGDVSPVPVYGLMTRDEVLRDRSDEVRRVLQGLIDSVNEFIGDRELGIALCEQVGIPREEAVVAYDVTRGYMQPVGPLPESIQREWTENAKQLAKVSDVVPISRAFDFSIIRELQPLCR